MPSWDAMGGPIHARGRGSGGLPGSGLWSGVPRRVPGWSQGAQNSRGVEGSGESSPVEREEGRVPAGTLSDDRVRGPQAARKG